ncbi:hypothetical protein KBB48_02520 [Candidatus Shapirobacteria bacterium]|nr:hypothetical protein [Candidatus Shapirobacteria bacterium]
MKKIILLLGWIIFLSSRIPSLAATSCQGRSDCPSGYECVYLNESGVPRLDSTNSKSNAFCARIYQGVTSVPTKSPIPTGACKILFWFDDNNFSCNKKEFCGRYMYQGLRTFQTLEECKANLPKPKYAKEGEPCGGGRPDSRQCEPGLRCDYSKNTVYSDDGTEGTRVGASGICVKITPTAKPIKYAKEGEFCGAGPEGVVWCEPGLKCDESRNRIDEESGREIVGERIGVGGICVRITPTAKPTKIDDCRLKVCGDANCDGKIDTIDRLTWIRERFSSGRNADFNKDGKVDMTDYSIVGNGIKNKCQPMVTPRLTLVPTKKPIITPTKKLCNTNSDCQGNEYCYQPPMPTCPKGENCLDVMPKKYCAPESPVTPLPTTLTPTTVSRLTPSLAPTKAPVTKKFCETDSDCSRMETCYQPPMPTCPPGENCIQVMPQKYCKSAPVSEVTGVEEISKCQESKGDANKDGKVNLGDYALWRFEYAKGSVNKSDFNCDKKVDLIDYKIWKEVFLETKGLMVNEGN